MNEISIVPMTIELCRQYYKKFESDPMMYMDMSLFKSYIYSDSWVDTYYDRQIQKKRIFFAIMLGKEPVGEILLKEFDYEKKECTLGVHLQNDSVKGLGIGTQAEKLALKYAFYELNMAAVNADAVLKNERSQHVLEKVGFHFMRQEGIFKYYRCEKKDFKRLNKM